VAQHPVQQGLIRRGGDADHGEPANLPGQGGVAGSVGGAVPCAEASHLPIMSRDTGTWETSSSAVRPVTDTRMHLRAGQPTWAVSACECPVRQAQVAAWDRPVVGVARRLEETADEKWWAAVGAGSIR
jgi:hypothetical protein